MLENLQRNIKKIRELKNVTQEYLANELGISIRAYSKIETGETKLTVERINQISIILKVVPEEILAFDESKLFNHLTPTEKIETTIQIQEKLVEQYEARINQLIEENGFLKRQLEKLLKD